MDDLEAELTEAVANLTTVSEASDADTAAAMRRRDEAICALLDAGYSYRRVAAIAGLSHTHIRRIQQENES